MQWTKGKNAGFSTSAPDKLHPDKSDDHGVIYLDKQILFAAGKIYSLNNKRKINGWIQFRRLCKDQLPLW